MARTTTLPDSPRLRFRPVEAQDLDFIFHLQSDPVLMRYIRPAETDPNVVRERIETWTTYAAKNPGLGVFLAESKEDGGVVGYVTLRHYDFIPGNDLEVGYVIASAYAGKGIATEITQSLTKCANEEHGATKTVAYTDPENIASMNVLTKCGYLLVGLVEAYGGQNNLFERLHR